MQHKSARAIDELLGDFPLDERICALAANIIERRPEGVKATISLLALIGVMAHYLPAVERFSLAETMRDAADEVERYRELVY